MTFLPIVGRELREAARRRSTYWVRLAAALAALLTGSLFFLGTMHRSSKDLGIVLFVALAVVTFVYCLLAGAWRTCDCLSVEKREGTLGLLFLTDLKGYDIVLGKLAATSLNTLYGMLAVFPVMAIPMLMGGVSGAEFGRVILVGLNCLFFSLAVGMFCSAVSRDERRSAALALGILILVSIVLPIIGGVVADAANASEPDLAYFLPSPGYACFMAFDVSQRSAASFNYFYPSVATVHALGWVFLILASVIVPRTWRDSARQSSWRTGRVSTEMRDRFRTRLLAVNPFYWLASRPPWKAGGLWTMLVALAVIWLLCGAVYTHVWWDAPTFIITTVVAHTLLKLWLVSEAARRLAADRRSGALELMLCTPLQVRAIIDGQLAALWRQFALPSALVLAMDLAFAIARRSSDDFVTFYVVVMIVFVADMVTLSWLGMWLGLRGRSANRAVAGAAARILVLPWLILIVLTFLEASHVLPQFIPRPRVFDDKMGYIIGLAIALCVDLIFGLQARRGLLNDFRAVAAGREKREA